MCPAVVSYIPQPTIKISGEFAPPDLLEDLVQISIEESLHLPGMFTFMFRNDYFSGREEDATWKYTDLFKLGNTVQVGFVSSTTEATEFSEAEDGTVFDGEITAVEAHFTSQAEAPIIVRGYDVSHRLHRGRYSRSFQNETDSDIVKKIAGEVGIPIGTVDETGGPFGYGDINDANGYIFQQNQTNMEFLRSRAARYGYELFVQDGKLYFRKPKQNASLSLKWLKDLHSFRVQVTNAEQVSSVEVRGWDIQKKAPIIETSNASNSLTTTQYGKGEATATCFKGKPPTPKLIVVDQCVSSNNEAQKIATALCDELGDEFVQGDAMSEGNPNLRPGKLVKLVGLGQYSGDYYITATRHLFHERKYTTEFSVRGLRGGDLLSMLSPPTQLQPGQTCLAAIVTDNKDPKGWGRVRVKFPTLTEEHASYWARVVTLGAGPSRGMDWLPEINDEVLVAFEHADIHRPYIIGNVWNGMDAPPEAVAESVVDGKVRLRTLKTRVGHKLQFVEETKGASKQGMYLETKDKHYLHINDTDKYAELKTVGKIFARLDDQNKKLELQTTGGHTMLMNDQASSLQLTSSGSLQIQSGKTGKTSTIQVDGGSITLTGQQSITLKVGPSSITLSPSGIEIKGVQVTVQATSNAKVQGMMVDIQGSGMTNVKGGIVKIN
ncbi:VgrG-related protein [Leptolyngbya sp. AN02str]|uniref:VgrG-related protein n=1 Tax=Leptolyngbya sp. AN02str TaxID=3423363 RepID=UPI003D31D913